MRSPERHAELKAHKSEVTVSASIWNIMSVIWLISRRLLHGVTSIKQRATVLIAGVRQKGN